MTTRKGESAKNILLDIRRMLRWFLSGEGALVTIALLLIGGLLTFLIQDAIQRQRYLELLELELRSNYSTANIIIKSVNDHKYLYTTIPIHTEVYNAGLQQGYLITLDPTTQAQLYTLYGGYFQGINDLNNHYLNIINEYQTKWEECIINNTSPQYACTAEHNQFMSVQQIYWRFIAQNEVQVLKKIQQTDFNPTDDRLHPKTLEGFILRFFIGDKSLKIQQ